MISTKKNILVFLVASAIFSASVSLSAQQVIINSDGERVVIFPDGSWRTYEDSDSSLIRKAKSKGEVYTAEEKPKAFEYELDNPNDIRATMQLANDFADLTLRQSREANRQLVAAQDAKFQAEAKYQQARENKNLIEPDQLVMLEEDLDLKTDLVKRARKHHKKATKFAEDAYEIINMPAKKQYKALDKLMLKHRMYWADRSDRVTLDRDIVPVETTPVTKEKKSGGTITRSPVEPAPHTDARYANYDRQPSDCIAVRSEKDNKGRPVEVVIQREEIFSHTDDDLRPYFRDEDLITCSGQVSQIGDYVYLSIEFSIASPNAQKNFGGLPEGSLLRLVLVDGTEVDLNNLQGNSGRIDPYSGNTLFIGRYLLEKEQQRKLTKKELDHMRVVWRVGYEDYDIYAVDFLIDQFSCLNKYQ